MTATIDDPRTWPLVDYLPMTRPIAGDMFPQPGVMIPQRPFTVFLLNVYDPKICKRLATCERLEYASEAELRADGWLID